jgi:hypothetical protein
VKNQNGAQTDAISEQDGKLLERYKVTLLPADEIHPSPENEEVYGPIGEDDVAMPMLIRSIKRLGLEEPLILTRDHYILSGHRRFYALQKLGWPKIPVRLAAEARGESADYHRRLAEYNPQRVKSVAATLAEALLENEAGSSDSWDTYEKKRAVVQTGHALIVPKAKTVKDVGDRQVEFLEACQMVVNSLRAFWPVTIRQIHYKLLNSPPLTQATKDRKECWRYKNDKRSYAKLSDLLVSARYSGYISFDAIDDATRPSEVKVGWTNQNEFVNHQVKNLLKGYHRDRQEGQPHHIELLAEKNTLLNIIRDIAKKFYVPLTPLRGYGGPSLWQRIQDRYNASGKDRCIVIILSDHDPEGLDLADDCVRSLRDNHDVPVEARRPLLTLDQVRRHNLHPNWAKETSARYRDYVRRAGTNQCWECEALDPERIRECVHEAILGAMNVDQLNAVQEREDVEKKHLVRIRTSMSAKLREMIGDGEL